MRQILFSTALLFLISCTSKSQQAQNTASNIQQAKVLIYFFHGTHRCTGCINAEKATITVLNELYKDQQDMGIIKFQSVNIEEDQNKALAEKYQVAWNMLLLVPVKDEKNKVELTEQAFTYGTNPEGFKPYIKSALDPMLY